jgi:hypothetical protein
MVIPEGGCHRRVRRELLLGEGSGGQLGPHPGLVDILNLVEVTLRSSGLLRVSFLRIHFHIVDVEILIERVTVLERSASCQSRLRGDGIGLPV